MTLRDKMLAVIADTNDSVAEREELVEMIAISLLTRKNLFVLGEPGQAKSYAINLFRRHITGARQFERLLSKQSDEEQLFGRVDLASLLPGSVPPTVLEQDATYQNQRFNLRVLVEGIGSMKDEPATWEKLKSGTEKLELYRAALSALHKSEPTVQTAGKIPEADILRSRRCVKGGSFRPMKRRQSLLPRPRENWITYFPNWAENLALCRRWKSWSRQRKPQRTSSRHCWSSFVGLRRTIRL